MSYDKLVIKDGWRQYVGVPIGEVNKLIDDLVHENNNLFSKITISPNGFGRYNVLIDF